MAVTQSARATFRPLQSAPADSPAFSIRGLTTTFPGAKAPTVVVDDISLFVRRGETLAVVGESGSGKTMTFHSALGLVPHT